MIKVAKTNLPLTTTFLSSNKDLHPVLQAWDIDKDDALNRLKQYFTPNNFDLSEPTAQFTGELGIDLDRAKLIESRLVSTFLTAEDRYANSQLLTYFISHFYDPKTVQIDQLRRLHAFLTEWLTLWSETEIEIDEYFQGMSNVRYSNINIVDNNLICYLGKFYDSPWLFKEFDIKTSTKCKSTKNKEDFWGYNNTIQLDIGLVDMLLPRVLDETNVINYLALLGSVPDHNYCQPGIVKIDSRNRAYNFITTATDLRYCIR